MNNDFIDNSLKYLDEEPKKRKKSKSKKNTTKKSRVRKSILAIVLVAAVAAGGIFFYRTTHVNADITSYADAQIEVDGITDEPIYITPAQLAKMKITKETVTGKSQKAGTFTGVGPTLATFVASYGETVDSFKQVKFYAKDDYSIVLVESLHEKTVIMSVANGDDPLEDSQQPLRIVVPGEDSSKWIRSVTKIVFTRESE